MPTSLEACRLLMLALSLAAIPLAFAVELAWDRMPEVHRHRGHGHSALGFRGSLLPWLSLGAAAILALIALSLWVW